MLLILYLPYDVCALECDSSATGLIKKILSKIHLIISIWNNAIVVQVLLLDIYLCSLYDMTTGCRYLHGVLCKNQTVTEQNLSLLVETLRSISEILIWGDQNDSSVFE